MTDLEVKLKVSQEGITDVNASLLDLAQTTQQTDEKVAELDTTATNTQNALVNFGNSLKDHAIGGFNLLVDHAIGGLTVLAARTVLFGFELKEAFSQEKTFTDANRMFENTAEEAKKLRSELNEIAVTKLGIPVEEINHLAKIAGTMGKASDEVTDFILTSAEAALSFNVPAEQLMQSLGGVQTALKLTNDQLPTFTDQIKAAADSATGMSTEVGIMEALADGVAVAGRAAGLSAGEMIAFTSATMNVDGNVQNTSSALSSLFLSFKNVTGQNADFKTALLQLGTSADKFAQDVNANPVQAIQGLLHQLSLLTPASKINVIGGLVGENQNKQKALLNLTDSLGVLQQQLKATGDETVYAGEVHKAYLAKLETADAKLELMSNSFRLLGAAIANPFLPAIKLAIDSVTDFTAWLAKSTENSPFLEIIIKSTQLFLGLGGAIHIATLLFTPVVAGLGLMLRGFSTLAPFIVAATTRVYGYITALRVMAVTQMAAFSSGTSAGFSFIGMLSKMGASLTILGNGLKFLVGGALGVWGIALTAIGVSLAYLSDQTSKLGETSAKNSEIAWAAWDVFLRDLTDGLKPVIDLFNKLSSGVSVFMGGSKELAVSLGGAWDGLMQKVLPFYGALKDIYALLSKTDTAKKFKIDVEEQVKQNREKDKAEAKPQEGVKDTGNAPIDVPTSAAKTAADAELKIITDKLKAEGAAVDAETTRQNEALKAALAQRLADIEAMTVSKLQKELLITQAVKAANDAQLLIIQQTAISKLSVIDSTYTKEIAAAGKSEADKNALDKESLTARLTVYQAQEKAYSSMISSLIAEEQKLTADTLRLTNERKGIEQSYADFKIGLNNAGKTDYQKITDEKARLDALVTEQKKALALGDVKTAEELNAHILELGKDLATKQKNLLVAGEAEITQARKDGLDKRHLLHTLVYQSEIDNTLKITDKAQAALLATNTAAQNSNKARLGELSASAEDAKSALAGVQTVIDHLNKELQVKHAFQIAPNTLAVDAAIARISEPTQSTHTINVVENRSGGTSTARNPQVTGYKTGGYITGKGTGTSDDIPAIKPNGEMLAVSNGEYIITADKVKQYGVAAFDDVNYGNKSPEQINVKRYATGGVVSDDRRKKARADIEARDYDAFETYANYPNTQLFWSNSVDGRYMAATDAATVDRNFRTNALAYLEQNRYPREFLDRYMGKTKALLESNNKLLSAEARADALLRVEDFSNPSAQTDSPVAPAPALSSSESTASPRSSVPPPNYQPITPAGFVPPMSRAGSTTATATGKSSTITFVAPDNKTITGQFADGNAADFFDQLNQLSGVSKR